MRGRARRIGAAFTLLVCFRAGVVNAAAAELTEAEKTKIWKQGEISARAQACGLDWEALSFRPMMAYWRRQGKSEQDMALIGAYHGAAQGYTRVAGPCTHEMRRKLKTQLPFKG